MAEPMRRRSRGDGGADETAQNRLSTTIPRLPRLRITQPIARDVLERPVTAEPAPRLLFVDAEPALLEAMERALARRSTSSPRPPRPTRWRGSATRRRPAARSGASRRA